MRKVFVILLSFLLLSQTAVANDTNDTVVLFRIGEPAITVTQNGVPRTAALDVAPIIIDGRAMIPIRAFAQAFGGEPIWDARQRRIDLVFGDLSIVLFVGSQTAYWNLTPITLTAPPVILNGRVMVPLRTAEFLGATVTWDGSTQTITILQKPEDRLVVKIVDPGVKVGGPLWFIPGVEKQIQRLKRCSPEHYNLFKTVGGINLFKGKRSEAHPPLGPDFGTLSASFTINDISYEYKSSWKDSVNDPLLFTLVHEARHVWQFLNRPATSLLSGNEPNFEELRSFGEWDAALEENIMGLRCVGDALGATPPDLSKVRSYTRSQAEIECYMPTFERYRNGTWPPDMKRCEAISAARFPPSVSNPKPPPDSVAAVSLKQPQSESRK